MALSKELARIATFRSWPSTSRMCSLKLAKFGFFYNGKNDEVECFKCRIHISGWNEGDDPKDKHRQVAPHCELLNDSFTDNEPTEKVAVKARNQITLMQSDESSHVDILDDKLQPHVLASAYPSILRQALSRAQRNGVVFKSGGCTINRTRPDFSMLQTEAERRSTFYDWPQSANGDPDALAQAGFYYTGTGDRVQCFTCKGVVSRWEPSDVPISEHRRLFPMCPFARGLNKPNVNEDNSGQSAVQQHQTSIASSLAISQPALIPERAIAVERAALTPEQMSSTKARDVIEREVKAKMDTPNVRAILDMGYSHDRVKEVIERRLSTAGKDFPNAESFLEAVFSLEEAETLMLTGATASTGSFASEDVNNSMYNNISTSCYSAGSSSASAVRPQSDFASLPPTNSARDSATSIQSKASASTDKKSISLMPESASVTSAPDDAQATTSAAEEIEGWMNLRIVSDILEMGYSRDTVKEVIETKLIGKGYIPNGADLLQAVIQH